MKKIALLCISIFLMSFLVACDKTGKAYTSPAGIGGVDEQLFIQEEKQAPPYQGYIVQFREKSLIEKKLDLEKGIKKEKSKITGNAVKEMLVEQELMFLPEPSKEITK